MSNGQFPQTLNELLVHLGHAIMLKELGASGFEAQTMTIPGATIERLAGVGIQWCEANREGLEVLAEVARRAAEAPNPNACMATDLNQDYRGISTFFLSKVWPRKTGWIITQGAALEGEQMLRYLLLLQQLVVVGQS